MVKMSTERPSKLLAGLSFGALVLLVTAGCQENSINYSTLTPTVPSRPTVEVDPDTKGVFMAAEPAVVDPTDVAMNRNFGVRSNPFALQGVERIFDREQRTERLLAEFGGWWEFDVPEDVRIPAPEVQPLPPWRLSGVIIGNGVLALLDTGSDVYEIRPGMTIPGTAWRVKSIDDERAVLVRDGNVLPREFYVDLQGIIGAGVGVPGGNTGGGNNVGLPGGRGDGGDGSTTDIN